MLPPIDHAKAYPFYIPPFSYVLTDGKYMALDIALPLFQLTDGRTPVIASGSNRSPEQLARKFKDNPTESVIVTKAALYDFDSVYSAHFAGYGSITATLQYTPGTISELSVTWLNQSQLHRMHETESLSIHYDYGCLSDIRLEIENGPTLAEAFVYNSVQGCMSKNGEVIALAEINSQNRSVSALTQIEVLRHARDQLDPDVALDNFIQDILNNPKFRMSRTENLQVTAIPFGYKFFRRIPTSNNNSPCQQTN